MKVIVIMGVSGSGKTTIGKLLAQKTKGRFLDGDDFHPPENITKMASGIPLNDGDRQAWLETLATIIHEAQELTIIACSALKASYRDLLKGADFVYLSGSYELLSERIQGRSNHYMPPALLRSQLETLEPPTHALTIDIGRSPAKIVASIKEHFDL